jgi:hypothetical protein
VLHGEWLEVTRLIAVSILPAPVYSFIEDDITGDDDALVDGVVLPYGSCSLVYNFIEDDITGDD